MSTVVVEYQMLSSFYISNEGFFFVLILVIVVLELSPPVFLLKKLEKKAVKKISIENRKGRFKIVIDR